MKKAASRELKIGHLPALPPLFPATWAPDLSTDLAKKIAVSTPQPDYPINARARRTQGRGVFTLVLTERGEVASIQILKSTGSQDLDNAAENALRKWRFKPGTGIKKVRIPIDFILTR